MKDDNETKYTEEFKSFFKRYEKERKMKYRKPMTFLNYIDLKKNQIINRETEEEYLRKELVNETKKRKNLENKYGKRASMAVTKLTKPITIKLKFTKKDFLGKMGIGHTESNEESNSNIKNSISNTISIKTQKIIRLPRIVNKGLLKQQVTHHSRVVSLPCVSKPSDYFSNRCKEITLHKSSDTSKYFGILDVLREGYKGISRNIKVYGDEQGEYIQFSREKANRVIKSFS